MRLPSARLAGPLALIALALAPRAASAQQRDSTTIVCKDGTTAQGSGGCGEHGGVDPAATKATQDGERDGRRPPRTGATIVICHDGVQSTAGMYACVGHGGVKSTPGQTGEVKAALRMEDHRSTVPKGQEAAPRPATSDTTRARPDSARKPASRPPAG